METDDPLNSDDDQRHHVSQQEDFWTPNAAMIVAFREAKGGQQRRDTGALELGHRTAEIVCHPEIGTIERYANWTGRSSHLKSSEGGAITGA